MVEAKVGGKILSIVIPVFNKYPFTKSCLNDLSKLSNDHEIIVVDNASIDNTEKELQDSTEIVYIRNEHNLGFGMACNIGYHASTANNVLFLNNDIRVKSDYNSWTQKLLEYCDDYLVGPTMGQLDNHLNFVKEDNKELDGKSYMSGWCLASSKKNWKKLDVAPTRVQYNHGENSMFESLFDKSNYIDFVEVFDEKFFCYFEDTDLSFRARELQIPFKVVDLPVVHFGKQTSKQLNVAELYLKARKVFLEKWKDK